MERLIMGGRGGGSPATRSTASTDWRSDVNMVDEFMFGVDVSFPARRSMPDVPADRLEKAMRLVESQFSTGEFVMLAPVRDALSRAGFSIGEQDRTFESLQLGRRANFITIANLKGLRHEDRRAAVFMGNEQKTAMIIER